MKFRGEAAGVLLGLGNEDTLYARKAVVHPLLRFDEVEVRVHSDELRRGNRAEADSPAE